MTVKLIIAFQIFLPYIASQSILNTTHKYCDLVDSRSDYISNRKSIKKQDCVLLWYKNNS